MVKISILYPRQPGARFTADSLIEAFMPYAAELQTDIANYTDIPPQIQFNDIVLESRTLA